MSEYAGYVSATSLNEFLIVTSRLSFDNIFSND